MYVAIVIMIALVFILQMLGNFIAQKLDKKKVGGQKNEEVLFSNIRCYCNSYFSCLWGNKQADQKEDKEITVAVQLESSKDILRLPRKKLRKRVQN